MSETRLYEHGHNCDECGDRERTTLVATDTGTRRLCYDCFHEQADEADVDDESDGTPFDASNLDNVTAGGTEGDGS